MPSRRVPIVTGHVYRGRAGGQRQGDADRSRPAGEAPGSVPTTLRVPSCFLASPDNGFVTGQCLFVCGGASLGSLVAVGFDQDVERTENPVPGRWPRVAVLLDPDEEGEPGARHHRDRARAIVIRPGDSAWCFSDETLKGFMEADAASYKRIVEQFAYWGGIDTTIHGKTINSQGHGFCGMSRLKLAEHLPRSLRRARRVSSGSTPISPSVDELR